MKANPEHEPELSARTEPMTVESLSESAIRRQLLSDTVQHPATLLPSAVAIMSISYLLLVSPVLGGRLWAAALLAVSGIVAATSFVWQYVFRYRDEYAKRVRERMDRLDRERARLERAELGRLREALRAEIRGGVLPWAAAGC